MLTSETKARPDANLFAALRAGFPADLTACAVETEDGLCYSWQDLEHGTAMIANLLSTLELPSGGRVVAQVEKSVEAMMLYLAPLRAGFVFVPLNIAYQKAEMAYFLKDAEPSVVVCSKQNFGWISKMAFLEGASNVFTLNADRTGSLLTRAAQHARQHAVVPVRQNDVAAIIYTSGTTGRSKGAMLSHHNLLSNAQVLHRVWGWRNGVGGEGRDVLLHVLPIFHVHGLFVAIHGALLSGSKMIWLSKFDPPTVLAKLPEATVFMGVPTLYVRLLNETGLTRSLVHGVRLFISGSAPMLLDTFNRRTERTGHTILERYGMSETIMLTSNPYHSNAGRRIGGTVGRALPGVRLRVTGDSGSELPGGEVGGIEVKGDGVFQGYWRLPQKTQEEFTPDGFFKTGDVGHVDENGYVTLVGRSKDLIISGGYNVYPAEVEGLINAFEGVAESAVVGIPDVDLGEVGVALVVAKPGFLLRPETIIATLKSMVANFKVPKRCVVVFELPRNAMGKVQKNLLRAQYALKV